MHQQKCQENLLCWKLQHKIIFTPVNFSSFHLFMTLNVATLLKMFDTSHHPHPHHHHHRLFNIILWYPQNDYNMRTFHIIIWGDEDCHSNIDKHLVRMWDESEAHHKIIKIKILSLIDQLTAHTKQWDRKIKSCVTRHIEICKILSKARTGLVAVVVIIAINCSIKYIVVNDIV